MRLINYNYKEYSKHRKIVKKIKYLQKIRNYKVSLNLYLIHM